MKLDRNNNPGGKGKYALLKLRNYPLPEASIMRARVENALDVLDKAGMLDFGNRNTESEFMVIRLKDRYAAYALISYAAAAQADDPEYASEIADMAARSGLNSPWCKTPD